MMCTIPDRHIGLNIHFVQIPALALGARASIVDSVVYIPPTLQHRSHLAHSKITIKSKIKNLFNTAISYLLPRVSYNPNPHRQDQTKTKTSPTVSPPFQYTFTRTLSRLPTPTHSPYSHPSPIPPPRSPPRPPSHRPGSAGSARYYTHSPLAT